MPAIRMFSLALAAISALSPTAVNAAPTLTTLYSFQGGVGDGAGPLDQLTFVGGTLYGTTFIGGPNASGTIFSYNIATKTEAIVYAFKGEPDGAGPKAGLIYSHDTFYGTTQNGGTTDKGTVFAFSTSTGESVLHSFAGGTTDGEGPQAAVTYLGGFLYGTTRIGGGTGCYASTGCGTIFRINSKTGQLSLLYDFQGGADGNYPNAALTIADGIMFSITHGGGGTKCFGGAGCGTVFEYDPTTKAYMQLHAFQGGATDGALPMGSLVLAGGLLYGTTIEGGGTGCGGAGCGTIFSINPVTGAYTNLTNFNGTDGDHPQGGLTLSVHRGFDTTTATTLAFGPTTGGGTSSKGTIFQFNLLKNKETVLYNFTGGADGGDPSGALTESPPRGGPFYGTTYLGGASQSGTLFQFKP